jgi:hypothetical protein
MSIPSGFSPRFSYRRAQNHALHANPCWIASYLPLPLDNHDSRNPPRRPPPMQLLHPGR